MQEKNVKIINNTSKNGQTKCPKCGASNLFYDETKHKLICNYCSGEYELEKVDGKEEAKTLSGESRGSATKDIDQDASSIITIRCDGCGAEIVLNTEETLHTQCHWCGSTLSINHQIDNGIVPDEILPFLLTREQAFQNIYRYVENKLDFASKEFTDGLSEKNVRGVYFPYFIIDSKAHGKYVGVGEHNTRVIHHDDSTYYDADVYHIEREFDVTVDDLTIESNLNRLDIFNTKEKNTVINAIMPFDTQNCIQFNANYLKEYTSEKRDVDVKEIEGKVSSEVNDIVRKQLTPSLKKYDRGVRWESEELIFEGKQWLSAYLPVWLYSCQDKKGTLHYVAVNGRTGETVGSIPKDNSRLALIIGLIFGTSVVLGILFLFLFFPIALFIFFVGFVTSLIIFIVEDYKYANLVWKRHHYETETKCSLNYTNCVDQQIDKLHRVSHAFTPKANSHKVYGDFISVKKNTK